MTKKLLFLCCALVMMCAGRISAQSGDAAWHVVADNHVYIPVSEVSYILFVDESVDFSIVKTDGGLVTPVSEVTFSQSVPESVEDVNTDRVLLSVFPNPVVSQLTLQGLRADAQVRVLSLDGATLIETQATQGNCRVDVSSLAAGIYMLQVNETTVKFIKK